MRLSPEVGQVDILMMLFLQDLEQSNKYEDETASTKLSLQIIMMSRPPNQMRALAFLSLSLVLIFIFIFSSLNCIMLAL